MNQAERLQNILAGASELPPDQRAAFIDAACRGDAELRAEVLSLLKSHDDAGRFLVAPTAEIHPDPAPAAPVSAAPSAERFAAALAREGPGAAIGPYKLLQLIGEGGFGSVFMAQQEQPIRRKVALKIIKLGMDTRQVVARFEQERQALAILDHPNIAKVFDAGATDSGRPYFVMELCAGEPIDAFCDRNSLSIRERLELFAQVCRAVQHAHTKGIIHRDIKPNNILVSLQDGAPLAKVIDFGIAKAADSKLTEKTLFTEHRQIIGTPEYMSPEQAAGSLDIDTRTDVYALGVVLYQLLAGSTPFSSKELRSAAYAEIQRIIREVDPPKPSTRLSQSRDALASLAASRRTEPARLGALLRGELDWIVMKALEKDRARRYDSAGGLLLDVARFLDGEAVAAAPPGAAYRARKFIRRHRAFVAGASAVAAALVIGAAGFAWQAVIARQQRDLALAARQEARDRAEGERAAREQAQKRLAQVERSSGVLASIFRNLDPSEIALSGRPLQSILVEHLDQAAVQLEGDALGDPLAVAAIQVDLGCSLARLGEPRKAAALLEKARATRAALLGPDHSETLTVSNDLALAYFDAGQSPEAQKLMEETLALRTARSGSSDRETITCMNNLALIYQKAGKPKDALALLADALERRKAVDGPDHPETANAMHNLALAYDAADDPDKAAPLVEEALRIRKSVLGASHPHTLLSMKLLASCRVHQDQPGEAEPILAETLAKAQAALGPDHPTTLSIATDLAKLYYQTRQLSRLQPLLEATLPAMRIKFGPDDPQTLNAMGNLAGAYWLAGQFDKSVPLFEETSAALERRLGRSHPEAQRVLANLGVNYASARRFQEAAPLLEEAYQASQHNPELTFARQALFDCCVARDQPARAAEILDDVLEYARKASPPHSPARAGALALIGSGLTKLKLYPQAETLLRECLALRAELQPDHWTTFNTRSLLGEVLAARGSPTEAEPLLLAGYQGLKEHEDELPPAARSRLPEAVDRLIAFYAALGRADEAEKWRALRAAPPAAPPAPAASK